MRPALREPHAPFLLQRVDQRIDGTGLERIAAHQQRVETECLAQLRVLDIARHHRIDGAPGLIFRQVGRGFDHGPEIQEGLVSKLLIAFGEHAFGIFHEAAISVHIGRVLRRDLRQQLLVVVRIIEDGSILPHQPVKGGHRHQFHIVGDVPPAQREQFLDAAGIGHHRRPRIKAEAIHFKDITTATGLVPRLDQRRLDAG